MPAFAGLMFASEPRVGPYIPLEAPAKKGRLT